MGRPPKQKAAEVLDPVQPVKKGQVSRPPKRKAAEIASPASPAVRKQEDLSDSSRKKKKLEPTASSTRPRRTSLTAAPAPGSTTRSASNKKFTANGKPSKSSSKHKVPAVDPHNKNSIKLPKKGSTRAKKASAIEVEEAPVKDDQSLQIDVSVAVPAKNKKANMKRKEAVEESEDEVDAHGSQYWLMKAEPESRIEKGKDVKFSIDDLKAAKTPEPWDGVRNLEARNNIRAMMKGDQAFFYHSNCKVPGVVGTMEIVQEHSIDESAFDPEHPYYDEKSNRDNPKWHVVHVEFRQKFPEIVKLKELQKFSKEGGILENMQTLRRTRLSVSKVSKKEWDFIMSLVDSEDIAAASVHNQPQMATNEANGTNETHNAAE